MAKIHLTPHSRFSSNDLPILSLPRIAYESARNTILCGFLKIVSLNLSIRNKGMIRIVSRLYVNLFTNTLNASFHEPTYIHIDKGGKLEILGTVFMTNGCRVSVFGQLTIGDGTYLNARTSIICTDSVTIGAHCAISWDVSLLDTDVHQMHSSGLDEAKKVTKPITIGDHVWIGAHATILKGVTIGSNAIVAANSVVTSDVEPNTLVGGTPARVLKANISWK